MSRHTNQTGKESIARSSYKAPKITKSPFPDEFCMPSPAMSNKKSASRHSTKRDRDGMASKHQAPDQQEVDPRIKEEDELLNDFFDN